MTAIDEKWLPVVGYEDHYEVSNFGRVRGIERIDSLGRMRKAKELKINKNKKGYRHIILSKNGVTRDFRIGRLVLSSFCGPCPEGMEAAHSNGNNGDDRLENLRWATHLANIRDKNIHGTMPSGEKHHWSKIKDSDIHLAMKMKKRGKSCSQIAEVLGVTRCRVWQITRHAVL